MKFPEKLKKLRIDNGLTQEALAKKIFVSRTLITKYETGIIDPTYDNVLKLANLFNIKPEDLIDNDDAIELSLRQLQFGRLSNLIYTIIIICLSTITLLFYTLPIFIKWRYVYPIPPEQQSPNREKFNHSIISFILDKGNILGWISIFFCIINIILSILILMAKKKQQIHIFRTINYLLFIISLFLILFTFIICGIGAYS